MNPTVLSPCPSCGGAAIGPKKSSSGDERNGYNFTVTIRCECGFNASRPSREGRGGWCIDKGEAEAELIALWNKRTPITKLATESVERVPQTMIDRIRGYGRDFAFSGSFSGDMEAVADILATESKMDAEHWAELHKLRAERCESTSGKTWQEIAVGLKLQLNSSTSTLQIVSDELALIEAVLRGYRQSMASSDGLRAVNVIRAATKWSE